MKYILFLLCIYSIPITSHTSDTHIIADILSREPAYTHKQMFVESSYRHYKISRRGAVGILQVKPVTASELLHMSVTVLFPGETIYFVHEFKDEDTILFPVIFVRDRRKEWPNYVEVRHISDPEVIMQLPLTTLCRR